MATYYSAITSTREDKSYYIEIVYPGDDERIEEVRMMADAPVVLTYDSDDKLSPIVHGGLRLSLYSDTDGKYRHLMYYPPRTVEARLYKAQRIKRTGLAGGKADKVTYAPGELLWRGVMDGEEYQEDYSRRDRYPVRLTFADFGGLRRVRHTLKGTMSVRTAIVRLCDALSVYRRDADELLVPEYTWLSRTVAMDEDRPVFGFVDETGILDAHIDTAVLREDSGEPLYAYDALEGILRSFGLRIEYRNNTVHVYELEALRRDESRRVPLASRGDDAVLMADKLYTRVEIEADTRERMEQSAPIKLGRVDRTVVEPRQDYSAYPATFWDFEELGQGSARIQIRRGTTGQDETLVAMWYDGAISGREAAGGLLHVDGRWENPSMSVYIIGWDGDPSSDSKRPRLYPPVTHAPHYNAGHVTRSCVLPRISKAREVVRMLTKGATRPIYELNDVPISVGGANMLLRVDLEAMIVQGSPTQERNDIHIYRDWVTQADRYRIEFAQLSVHTDVYAGTPTHGTRTYRLVRRGSGQYEWVRNTPQVQGLRSELVYREPRANAWTRPSSSPGGAGQSEIFGEGLLVPAPPGDAVSVSVHVLDSAWIGYKEIEGAPGSAARLTNSIRWVEDMPGGNLTMGDDKPEEFRGDKLAGYYPMGLFLKNLSVSVISSKAVTYSDQTLKATAREAVSPIDGGDEVEELKLTHLYTCDDRVQRHAPTCIRFPRGGKRTGEVTRWISDRPLFRVVGTLMDLAAGTALSQYARRGRRLEGTFAPSLGLGTFDYFGVRYLRTGEEHDLRNGSSYMRLAELFAEDYTLRVDSDSMLNISVKYSRSLIAQPAVR